MAARAFFLPGIVLLFCAFILSLLVAISLPGLPALDIVRCHFTGNTVPHVSTDTVSIKEIRFGIWAYCIYDAQTDDRTCIYRGHGYSTQLISAFNNVVIGSGSTRGLAVYPFATGATFIALLLSLSSHITLALFSSFLAFIAALLTLIAFAIDIALFIIVHDKVLRLPNVQLTRGVTKQGSGSHSCQWAYSSWQDASACLVAVVPAWQVPPTISLRRNQGSFPGFVVVPEWHNFCGGAGCYYSSTSD